MSAQPRTGRTPKNAGAHEAQLVAIDSLKPYPGNARTHNLEVIRESLRVNTQYRPVVVRSKTRHVLAGNGTVEAARAEGWSEVWATFIDCDAKAARRINLVDNRANDLAGWDEGLLAAQLGELPSVEGSGWSERELVSFVARVSDPAPEIEPIAPPKRPRTKRGDVWTMGDHRLLCGDATNASDVARLMDDVTATVAITSPPYADRRKYDESSGFQPIPPAEYVDWFEPVAANVATHLAADGSWFVNIKPGVTPDGLDTELYVLDLVLAHARRWGWHFATEFCWERHGVPKQVTRRFKNQFEPIYQFTRGDWKMRPDDVRHPSNDVPVAGGPGVGATTWDEAQGGNGPMFGSQKRQSNLVGGIGGIDQGQNRTEERLIGPGLAYPGNRLPTLSGSHEATGHSAAFPVGLPAFFIRAYSDPADAVLDPFAGSGSTLIACENEGRIGYGLEISPGYCDVIVDRWERHTGRKATRG